MNADLIDIVDLWRKLDLPPTKNTPPHQRRRNQAKYLRKKYGSNCCYCGEPMVFRKRHPRGILRPDDATIEHLMLKRFGGPNARWNLRLAHHACNNWADQEVRKVEEYLDAN